MLTAKKIVLVIGNGFDLDLGLKTSYKDFWESEFCPKDYPSPLIRHLNSKWNDDIDAVRWYDLENELHSFAIEGDKSDVVSEQELEYIKESSNYSLNIDYSFLGEGYALIKFLIDRGYIRIDDSKLGKLSIPYKNDFENSLEWRTHRSLQLIKEGLCKYLKSVEFSLASNFANTAAFNMLAALLKSVEAGNCLEIFSFNYTHFHDLGLYPKIKPQYMHGSCERGEIVIGTRDDLKIDNDYDFLQKVMDSSFRPAGLVKSLNEADEVIIFGHSLGENDRQYFTSFFANCADFIKSTQKEITIFTYDQSSEDDLKRSLQKMTDGNLSVLFSNNNLKFIKTANIKADQIKLLDFLLRHNVSEHFARDAIARIVDITN